MMKWVLIVLGLAVVFETTPANAQLGRLLKEGLEMAGKKVFGRTAKKASQEGTEQALKKAATTTVRQVGQESAETMLKRTGVSVVNHADDAAKAIAVHGSAVSAPLIKNFGDDGAKALTKLSPANARRMAIVSEELAAGGRGADWMHVLARKGDIAAEWIYKNKASLTVATVATAFLANPDPFLRAGEKVATTGIETAGKHVARPLIETTVASVTPSVVKGVGQAVTRPAVAMASVTNRHPWSFLLFTLMVLAVLVAAFRWLVGPWLPRFRRK